MEMAAAKRFKELVNEDEELNKILAEKTLKKRMSKESFEKRWQALHKAP